MVDIFEGTGAPLSAAGFADVANDLGGDVASLWSLLSVETRGFGYLTDKRPKILFERHIFHKRTGGRFSVAHPDISHPEPGGYSGGAAEYLRLKRAMVLDQKAALESASWGLGQVMGFNASSLGYADAQEMINLFKESEDKQLEGCARFIQTKPALRDAFAERDWARVAFFYNGKNYAKNHYDDKLRDFHATYAKNPPDIEVRAGQARLAYLGYKPGAIDGKVGRATQEATKKFRVENKLPAGNDLDPATLKKLEELAGV